MQEATITKAIKDIIKEVDVVISDQAKTKKEKSSFIVEQTMMRTDYWNIVADEPLVEELAEEASDFQIESAGPSGEEFGFDGIMSNFNRIKDKYNN